MKQMKLFLCLLLLVVTPLLAACTASSARAPSAQEPAMSEEGGNQAEPAGDEPDEPAKPASSPTAAESATGEETSGQQEQPAPPERVQVRWFVGLGAGTDAPVVAAQKEVVREFNASQDEIELILEVVENEVAYEVLAEQIEAGQGPDMVGPMGIRGRAAFPGAWLDLTELIEKHDYDLNDFDPALVEFYHIEGEGQLGIPFAVFPSFIFFNKDLFDAAGLPYPPQTYGEAYVDENGMKHEWNVETLRMLALKLTLDANGNNATSPNFDPTNIVQFGFGHEQTDMRGLATFFGAGNLVDGEGNAQFPDHWREAMKWYYKAMWEDHFYPTLAYDESELLNNNWFQTGRFAMEQSHLWYASCCTTGLEAEWDIAVMPSYQGQTTAKLHADTFSILKGTEHPDETFKVMTYLLGEKAEELAQIYGGMPARINLQTSYFDRLAEEKFSDREINWNVARASLSYPDNPSHEEGLPNVAEATIRYTEFWQLLASDPNVDVDAAIDQLVVDLQAIYDATK